MIVELFGLSNSGKSVLKRKLGKKYKISKFEDLSKSKKLRLFLKYFLKNPISTKYLFWKLNTNSIDLKLTSKEKKMINRMRNSYLSAVLAKAELYKKEKRIFVDEYSFQSIFMILQRKSSEKEIKKILRALPEAEYLLLFLGDKKRRYSAYKKKHPGKPGATLMPGSWISHRYAKKWMEVMEYNFNIAKKIVEKDFDRTKINELKAKYPLIYKRK